MSRPGLHVAATPMDLGGREEGGERAGDLTAGLAAAATSCASAVSRSAAIRALTPWPRAGPASHSPRLGSKEPGSRAGTGLCERSRRASPARLGQFRRLLATRRNEDLVMNKALMGGSNRGSRDGEPNRGSRDGETMALEDSWETRSQYDACQAPPERV